MKGVDSRKTRGLIDPEKRMITYLRISLTQSCNLKCVYCYDSIDPGAAASERLSDDEIIRVIEAFALLGIDKVRFTGGEPLLRTGIERLMARASEVDGIKIMGITTNGMLLESLLPRLTAAGLNRINISLDTLKPDVFKKITGADGISRVLSGIDSAIASGSFQRVKINTVVIRGINDSELPALASWALERGLDIRFIEFMPTGKSGWSQELVVGEDEMRQRVGLKLVPVVDDRISPGPSRSFRYKDFTGRISFISAVSRSFCAGCNRLRLSSDGDIYGCLFRGDKMSLKGFLDAGVSPQVIADKILEPLSRPGFRRTPGQVSVADYKPFMRKLGG